MGGKGGRGGREKKGEKTIGMEDEVRGRGLESSKADEGKFGATNRVYKTSDVNINNTNTTKERKVNQVYIGQQYKVDEEKRGLPASGGVGKGKLSILLIAMFFIDSTIASIGVR